MIYKISRYNVCNDRFSYILMYSGYNYDEVCSLISAYQFLTEEIFESNQVVLSLDCLKKILFDYYEECGECMELEQYISYMPFNEKDGWFWESNGKHGFYIDIEDTHITFIDYNQAVWEARIKGCEAPMKKWLLKNPERVEEIRQLILNEGKEL